MKLYPSLFVALNFLLTGCATHLEDYSMISNKNVNLQTDISKLRKEKNVEGEDKTFVILGMAFNKPTLKGALNNALEKGNGDLMLDASVYEINYDFLFGIKGIKIKGDVVNTKEGL